MWSPGKAVREWRERTAREAEIAGLTDSDLHDLGLSRRELVAIARMSDERLERMEGMAGAFGVDRALLSADGALRLEVTRTCAGCGDDAACRREFAQADGPRAERAGFCPNAATFRALLTEAGR